MKMLGSPLSLSSSLKLYNEALTDCQPCYYVPVSENSDVNLYYEFEGDYSASNFTLLQSILFRYICNDGSFGYLSGVQYVVSITESGKAYVVINSINLASIPCDCFYVNAYFIDAEFLVKSQWFKKEICEGLSTVTTCLSNQPYEAEPYSSEGYYIGYANQANFYGDPTIQYTPKVKVRLGVVYGAGVETTSKYFNNRAFETERKKTFIFDSECVPDFVMYDLTDVFAFGNIIIDGKPYKTETNNKHQIIDDKIRLWLTKTTLYESSSIYLECGSCYLDSSCQNIWISTGFNFPVYLFDFVVTVTSYVPPFTSLDVEIWENGVLLTSANIVATTTYTPNYFATSYVVKTRTKCVRNGITYYGLWNITTII